ncbi:MAG: hypothetical protein IIC75_02120 [Bacteroidetes bacterium]|nr:hypothetical protein [Bacteroidota bacterium]
MKVPDYLYDLFPELENTFEQIKIHLMALEQCKLNELYPKQNNIVLARTVYQFAVYNQIVLLRVIDLSDGILNSWANKNISSAFILLRALDENVSAIYDANIRLEKLIKEKDFIGIYKLIFNLQFGTRIKERIKQALEKEKGLRESEEALKVTDEEIEKAYSAQQILSVMDRISKIFPHHRDIYEYLCEYAHPNYDGLNGLYCHWEDKVTVKLSKENGVSKGNASKYFSSLEFFLKMFVEGHDGIIRKFNDITELSNEDLRSKRKDAEIYKKLP